MLQTERKIEQITLLLFPNPFGSTRQRAPHVNRVLNSNPRHRAHNDKRIYVVRGFMGQCKYSRQVYGAALAKEEKKHTMFPD